MRIPGTVLRLHLFGYCSLLLWCGFSNAQTDVLNLDDRRLFMSVEQRAAIDQSNVEVNSADITPGIEESAVEQRPEHRSVRRKLKLNGVVMRSDGKVFGWLNSNPAAEVRPYRSAVYANGFNGDEKFIVTAGKALVALAPGQSIVPESARQ